MQKKIISNKNIKTILQTIFVVIIFFFLGRVLIQSWNRLSINWSQINYLYLIISISLSAIAWAGFGVTWSSVLSYLGEPIKKTKAVKVASWSQVTRYIPGSIWVIFGRMYLGGKEELSKGKIIASIAVESVMMIIASVVLFLISLPLSKSFSLIRINKLYIGVFIISLGFLTLLHPKMFNKMANYFVKRIDKEAHFDADVSFVEILKLLLYYSIDWSLFGLGFFFLIIAFKSVSFILLPAVIGIFVVSWLIGFLIIFAPSGFGVREVAMVFLLSLYFSTPFAVLIAISSRIVMIIGELIVLAISSRF